MQRSALAAAVRDSAGSPHGSGWNRSAQPGANPSTRSAASTTMPRSAQNPSRAQPRQFSSPNNTTPDNDMDVRPEWNGTQLKLVAHLKACAQWMPQQQSGLDLFMEKGVIINSRQQVVLYGTHLACAYRVQSAASRGGWCRNGRREPTNAKTERPAPLERSPPPAAVGR